MRDVEPIAIAPTEIDTLLRMLRETMPALVGAADAVDTTTSERTWNPMDGSRPPYCPYVDVDVTTMAGPLGIARLTWDRAMWNDDDAARRTASLSVEPAEGERSSLSATVGAGFSGSVGTAATEVLVLGELAPVLRALVAELATGSE